MPAHQRLVNELCEELQEGLAVVTEEIAAVKKIATVKVEVAMLLAPVQTYQVQGSAMGFHPYGQRPQSVASLPLHRYCLSCQKLDRMKLGGSHSRFPGSPPLPPFLLPLFSPCLCVLQLVWTYPSCMQKRKLAKFDGRVAWESCIMQIEMVATIQGRDEAECALWLVSSLREPALEVLSHLNPVQRIYFCVVAALERRFGQHLQVVYWARLMGRMSFHKQE